MDAIAVLNAGSSSIKFSVFLEHDDALELIVRGQAEGLYTAPRFIAKNTAGRVIVENSWGDGVTLGHERALDHLFTFLSANIANHRVIGVGHRVVHGGLDYSLPVRVDLSVLAKLEKLVPLAPLHEPHNLAPIRSLLARWPDSAAGRLLRHRVPSRAAAGCASVRAAKSDYGSRRSSLRLSRSFLRIHCKRARQPRCAGRARQDHRATSRQRIEYVCDGSTGEVSPLR